MDSRSAHRYAVDLAGTLVVGSTVVSCRVRNLSLGGVFVVGPSVASGSQITLRFGGPGLPAIEATCTARWSTDEGSGLAFDGLPAADSYALSQFVRATRKSGGVAALAIPPRDSE